MFNPFYYFVREWFFLWSNYTNQVAVFINHMKNHLRESIELFKESLRYSLEGGELMFASYSIGTRIDYMISAGNPLDDIYNECRKHYDFIAQTKEAINVKSLLLVQQLVLNLKGQTKGKYSLDTDDYNEEECRKEFKEKDKINFHSYCIYKIMIFYLGSKWKG